jgi:hypothetical protein
VRQNRRALHYASDKLSEHPLLQETSVQSNKLAVQGSVSPVCSVLILKLSEPSIFFRAALGLGGSEICGYIASGATIGDLASELSNHMSGTPIYMLLPGQVQPLSPFLVQLLLRDVCV